MTAIEITPQKKKIDLTKCNLLVKFYRLNELEL